MSDAELLDRLSTAGPGIFARLAKRYNWEHATPLLTRAAIEVELPKRSPPLRHGRSCEDV